MEILYRFTVLQDFSRLDKALYIILGVSRSQIAQWATSNVIYVNNIPAKKSRKLNKTDVVCIYASKTFIQRLFWDSSLESNINTNTADNVNPYVLREFSDIIKGHLQELQIEVIAETKDYLILNKPRGLVVHAAPSVKDITLSDYLKFHNYSLSTLNGMQRCGIVHRLDKDTSGAILVAKNNTSHRIFSDMLKKRELGRIYICVISPPLRENCTVECFMGRNPHNRIKMAKLDKSKFPQARDSKSEFRSIMQSDNGMYELISVRLFSGRTHQIRVHLSTMSRYIYGDSLYSPESLNKQYTSKMLLHAMLLYFQGKVFSAKIPKDLLKFLKQNFSNYQISLEANLKMWEQILFNN